MRIESLSEADQIEVREQLAAIVESSDDAIISKNLDGIILSWNSGAKRIFGWSAEEVIGKPITVIIPPDRLQEEPQILARIRSGERVDHFETVRVAKDGRSLNISVTISPVRDAEGRIVGASKIARDVTAIKLIEDERRQLLERERAARLEAERAGRMKDEFLATLSHELRTPLNSILGYAQMLRTGAMKAEDLPEAIEIIERNARSQTQMIEDLLDLSRVVSGKIRLDVQRVDLATVVTEAVATVGSAADAKGVSLTSVLDPHVTSVRGDPNRLQQIVWNLLTNAVKFTSRGGKVQVSLERVNSHVEIVVSDTGEGIEPEFLPMVFERFSQADSTSARRHGGLGIGLSLVKTLVELHGGNVRAKSPGVGRGATFTIALPIIAANEPPEPARVHPKTETVPSDNCDGIDLAGIHVLVVDDEADARVLIARIIKTCGAEVAVAASMEEALAHLRRRPVHVLVCDLGMPVNDGFDLIRAVRALPARSGGSLPAAALSAFARSEDRRRALMAGFTTHVAKPVEPAELLAVVASLAGRVGK